jgi:hypothetical protein
MNKHLFLWSTLLAASLAFLSSCGGGVGSGGTGSFASGPITGFGSIIVNDIRFDDSTAQLQDGEGVPRTRAELHLGMTVDVEAGPVRNDAGGSTAVATAIRFDSELLGRVDTVDPSTSSFTVLGQRVVVGETTVFSDSLSGGIGALAAGQVVEVYGVFNPVTARYQATRVELRGEAPVWRLRGVVAQIDPVAKSVRVGSGSFAYGNASNVPADLAVGQLVRLRILPAPANFSVLSFGTALQPLSDGAIKLRGLVSAFSSVSSFSLNGRPVDASSAVFPNGSAGLVLGARVAIEGVSDVGVVKAGQVFVISEQQNDQQSFQLRGPITSLGSADGGFVVVVQGVTVNTTRFAVRYENGSAADLVVGRQIEVVGPLNSDRTRIAAQIIRFR